VLLLLDFSGFAAILLCIEIAAQLGGKLTYSHNDCGWHHFALDHEVADSDIEKFERVTFRMCGMHIDDATFDDFVSILLALLAQLVENLANRCALGGQ
jgi:hypothetical protein